MDAVILQENIEGLLNLVRMLLPGGGSAGCVYLDDLSALQRSIHKQINDLYSQRGKTPEQDATLCLAILQGYNVSMYANPEDEDRKRSVLQRSLTLLDVLPLLFLNNSCLRSVTVCRNCVKPTNFFICQ